MGELAPFRGRLLSRQFARDGMDLFAGRLGEASLARAQRGFERWQRRVSAMLGPASGLAALQDVAATPLCALLGFDARLRDACADAGFVLSHLTVPGRSQSIPMVVGPWHARIDGAARRSMQEAMALGVPWALSFNGHALRIADANRPWTRRYVEFDLTRVVSNPAELRVLWAVARAAALLPDTGGSSEAALAAGSRRQITLSELAARSDAHRRRLGQALQLGVREALGAVAAGLRAGLGASEPRTRTPSADLVAQALIVLYRLLFLLFAEARLLVPVWQPAYRDGYSIERLAGLAEMERDGGLWLALQAISRLAHRGCSSELLKVTAFNGQLFSPEHTPLAERAWLTDRTMRQVLAALTVAPGPDAARDRSISYADLGVEQLGSIYERVLDDAPDLERTLERCEGVRGTAREQRLDVARTLSRRAPRVSVRRKESGTFYTPRAMADYLVRETLAPLVEGRTSDEILRLRVLDPAMGSGAFLVGACRFLADAHAVAREQEGDAAARSAAELAVSRRQVAQRCLFGVDLNPVAVQLARLSLWLATLSAEAPLTFLDHHLLVGDSLLGASFGDLVRGWPGGTRARRARRNIASTLPLFDEQEMVTLVRGVMPVRARLQGPDDCVDAVRAKEVGLRESLSEGALARWLAAADAWCAWWLCAPGAAPPPQAWSEICDAIVRGRSMLDAALVARWIGALRATGAGRRFVHWPLHLPEVFFDGSGAPLERPGFDAVIGNPPWDMVRADAADESGRDARRHDSAALMRVVRESGLYGRRTGGHVNRYQLFLERSLSLVAPGGRLGMVLPWGLVSDHASAPLRRRVFDRSAVDTLVVFENAERVFPIHRGLRFLLLTSTLSRPTVNIRCVFGMKDPEALDRLSSPGAPDQRGISISRELLWRVSGESLDIPYVRSASEVELLDRLHAAWPSVTDERGWGATFGRELNATDDRDWFQSGGRGIPVIAGRDLVPFGVRVPVRGRVVSPARITQLLQRCPGVSHERLAYRDVASPTNRLTLVAAMLPRNVVSTHTLFCLRSPLDADGQWCLCALLNSFVANWLVRLRVSVHVTVALLDRLPVPRPARGSWLFNELVQGAREVAGCPAATGAVYARLQGLAAHAYGLRVRDLEAIVSTFPLIPRADRDGAVQELGRLRSEPR